MEICIGYTKVGFYISLKNEDGKEIKREEGLDSFDLKKHLSEFRLLRTLSFK